MHFSGTVTTQAWVVFGTHKAENNKLELLEDIMIPFLHPPQYIYSFLHSIARIILLKQDWIIAGLGWMVENGLPLGKPCCLLYRTQRLGLFKKCIIQFIQTKKKKVHLFLPPFCPTFPNTQLMLRTENMTFLEQHRTISFGHISRGTYSNQIAFISKVSFDQD